MKHCGLSTTKKLKSLHLELVYKMHHKLEFAHYLISCVWYHVSK